MIPCVLAFLSAPEQALHERKHAPIGTHERTPLRTIANIRTHAPTDTNERTCSHEWMRTDTHTSTHTHMRTPTHARTHVYASVYAHPCAYLSVRMYAYAYAYKYAHICTHTHVRTHYAPICVHDYIYKLKATRETFPGDRAAWSSWGPPCKRSCCSDDRRRICGRCSCRRCCPGSAAPAPGSWLKVPGKPFRLSPENLATPGKAKSSRGTFQGSSCPWHF